MPSYFIRDRGSAAAPESIAGSSPGTRKQTLPKESGLLKGKYISAGHIIYSLCGWPGGDSNMFATKQVGLRIKEV